MFITQPFPGYPFSVTPFRFTFLAGFVVFLILLLFRPFNIDYPANHFNAIHAALYGLGTFVAATANAYLLPLTFKKLFREESWNVGKEMLMMLWQVVSITFINLAITHFLYRLGFSFSNVINFLAITAAVGIFPITLIILLKQQILFRKYAYGAAELEEQLKNQTTVTAPQNIKQVQLPDTLTLTGENISESLELPAGDLLYISAADNYIKVNYLQSGKPVQKVLRSTLKKAEATLDQYPQLFRCHRAYLVNLGAVSHISGNAQGFKLHLCNVEEPIPVSRNLNSEITLLLNQHSLASR